MGCFCLSHTGNVIAFTFNCHQGCLADQIRTDQITLPGDLTFGQLMFQKYFFDRIQIKISWQVHNGEILVIELTVCFGVIAISFDQVTKETEVFADMTIHIHAHKTG